MTVGAAQQERILFIGGAGSGNMGDEALLRAAVAAARKARPQAELTVATADEPLARRTLRGMRVSYVPAARQCLFRTDEGRHYWLADEVFRSRWTALRDYIMDPPPGKPPVGEGAPDFVDLPRAQALLAAMATADTIVIYGGGILTSATRSRLWEMGLMATYTRRHRKKLLLRSHQIGPMTHPTDENVMHRILSCASRMTLRDSGIGEAEVERLRGDLRVDYRLLPDDALAVRLPPGRFNVADAGLKPNGYIAVGYRVNKSVGVATDFLGMFAEVCNMAKDRFGLPLVLVPQGDFDIAGLREVQERLRPGSILFQSRASQWDIVKVLEDSRFTIATPHHSLIFALRKAKPVLSPVVGGYYAHKNRGSMRYFGLEEEVLPAEDENFFQRAADRVGHLHRNYTAIRKRLKTNVTAQKKAIEQSEAWFWNGTAG